MGIFIWNFIFYNYTFGNPDTLVRDRIFKNKRNIENTAGNNKYRSFGG